MATSTTTFMGFRPEAVQFLADLGANNERAWFQPRKAEYERLLKAPLEALVAELADRFASRGLPLRADPSRSPFRIYRDVRFSKDKSPYKTNIGADFPWIEPTLGAPAGSEPRHGMGGYFHVSPGEIYVGGGMWHPEPTRLAAWRRTVADESAAVHRAIEDKGFIKEFGTVSGDQLKRVPPGYPADHPDAGLLRLKDVTFGRRLGDDEVFSPRLPDLIADAFAAAVPVFRLLAGLAD